MPIRGASEAKQITFELGLDDSTVVDSPATKGTLSRAWNADLIDESLVKSRNGYTKVNSDGAWGSRNITQGFEYTTTSGSKEVLIYGESSPITGTSGTFGKLDATLTPTTISSSLVDNIKPSFLQFGTLAFCFNGTDDFVYDGTSTRQIGITAPVSAPTYTAQINGNLEQSSNYIFCYTYYNSVTGAESSPSPASATMTTGGSAVTDGLTIAITAGSSTTADTIRVWRSVAGGATLFLDGTTGISSTSYNSTVADAELGDELELDNSRPPKCPYAVVAGNRIFIAGDSNNPNRVYYSKIGINGAMPESFQADDFADCNPNDGDIIIALGVANDTVIVLKEKSVGKLNSIQIATNTLELEGSQKFIYEELANKISCVSHHAAVTVDKYFFWLGKDDVFGTDGDSIQRHGTRIKNTLAGIDFAYASKFSAINKSDAKQIIFSVVESGQTTSDIQLIGHYRKAPNIAFTVYTPGDRNTYPGIQAASLFSVTNVATGSTYTYFGSSAATGYVYQMDSGLTDDGDGIYFDVRLRWDAFDAPAHDKLWHSFYTLAVGNGNNYALTHTLEVENDSAIVATSTSSLFTATGSTWSSSTWSTFYWTSLSYKNTRFFPRKRAKFARYGFNCVGASQPVAIKGVTTLAQIYPIHR